MDDGLTILEAAERVGLSVDTLRYYERAGLLPHVLRTRGGQRRYDADNLHVIHFVTRMRATGMPIRRIREYMEAPSGPSGASSERRMLLLEHREAMIAKMQELTEALALIDKKIALYDANGFGCTPHPAMQPEREIQHV